MGGSGTRFSRRFCNMCGPTRRSRRSLAPRRWRKRALIRTERSTSPAGRARRTMGRRSRFSRSRAGARPSPASRGPFRRPCSSSRSAISTSSCPAPERPRSTSGGGTRVSSFHATRAGRGACPRRRMARGSGQGCTRRRLPRRRGRARAEPRGLLEHGGWLLSLPHERGGGSPQKALDIAVILGVLHAGRARGARSVLDPKAQATLTALEDLFEAEYAINRDRPPDRGPAMGRYANDAYYGGNPWYLATLAAAEFYFALASALRSGARACRDQRQRALSPTPRQGKRGRGRFRTRRYVHANRAGIHAAERRPLGAIRSGDGRSDFRQKARLELCRLHHRRREPPPGRPGHSRVRSLRDRVKRGVTMRLPNCRRSPKAWRISMLA